MEFSSCRAWHFGAGSPARSLVRSFKSNGQMGFGRSPRMKRRWRYVATSHSQSLSDQAREGGRATFAWGRIGPTISELLVDQQNGARICRNAVSVAEHRRIGHGQTGGRPFILAEEKDRKIRYCGFSSSSLPLFFWQCLPKNDGCLGQSVGLE